MAQSNGLEDRLTAIEDLVKNQHAAVTTLLDNTLEQQKMQLSLIQQLLLVNNSPLPKPAICTNDKTNNDHKETDVITRRQECGDNTRHGAVGSEARQPQRNTKTSNETNKAIGAQERAERYVNWEEVHDPLQQHCYVPVHAFTNYFKELLVAVNTFQDASKVKEIWNNITVLLKSPVKLNCNTRFPSEGEFVNVNTSTVQDRLKSIVFINGHCQFERLWLAQLLNVKTLNALDRLHNRESFEKHYNLIWDNADTNVTAVNGTATGYINWDNGYKPLESHRYVSLSQFNNSMKSFVILLNNKIKEPCQYDFINTAANIWDITFKIDKHTRFPMNGEFVNVETPLMKLHINNFFTEIYNAWKCEYGWSASEGTAFMQTITQLGIDTALSHLSFEQSYNLTWVDEM